MTTILSLNNWFETTNIHGTSGDQVSDILYSWRTQLDEFEHGLVSKECVWIYMLDAGCYETECKQSFYFFDYKKLDENVTFKFCPFCGNEIKEIMYSTNTLQG